MVSRTDSKVHEQEGLNSDAKSGSLFHGHLAQLFVITVAQLFAAMWLTFSLTFTDIFLTKQREMPSIHQ